MSDDSMETLYNFAERAFIRIQAGEVLTRCLEVSNISPIHKLVETLVLAGPDSLNVFREVLAETNLRKSQIETDLNQVLGGLRTNLESYGVTLKGARKASTITRLKPARFIGMLRTQGVLEEKSQLACLQLLQDAREIVISLGDKHRLLSQAEKYLVDWMWGILYETTRQGSAASH